MAKVGGLADVIYSLPKALLKIGADARVIIPKYEQIKIARINADSNADKRGYQRKSAHNPNDSENYIQKTKFLKNTFIEIGGKKEKISLYKTKIDGVEVFFVENKKYLSKGPIYYSPTAFSDDFKEIQRFVFFSVVVFELLRQNLLSFKPDIIHCNDWHSGALISLIKKFAYLVKTVFTIHNLANQGKWDGKSVKDFLGLGDIFVKFGKNANLMAEGIMKADFITTVSPTYAKEIITKECGEGLEDILKKRKDKLSGILNGIDCDFFNPASDLLLHKNYSLKNFASKKENKFFLQKERGLNVGDKYAVFGLVSRLTKQKGINLIISACGRLVKKYGCQFIFLGKGELRYERALKKLSKKYPKNIFVKIGFDEKLAHGIYAGSDFFLMPSLFEPCGLGQMIALRYGTIPIVRKAGGLKDTICEGKNGFLFDKSESRELKKAMLRALRLFNQKNKSRTFGRVLKHHPKVRDKFEQMQKYGMSQDFSWQKSAAKYKNIYSNLLKSS